jgi:hypothetical protein
MMRRLYLSENDDASPLQTMPEKGLTYWALPYSCQTLPWLRLDPKGPRGVILKNDGQADTGGGVS